MSYPEFLVIGSPRSGTTWLYYVLKNHPDIFLPPLKELHYFDILDPSIDRKSFRYRKYLFSRIKHNFGKMGSFLLSNKNKNKLMFDPLWDLKYFTGKLNDEWYKRLFRHSHKLGMITGEITPSYCLLSPEYISKVLTINKNMKFIYVLRNPVDRSWSHAVKILSKDIGVKLSDVTSDKMVEFFDSSENIRCGLYAENIRKYLSLVDDKNFLVLFFDDIKASPNVVLNDIYSFLGVKVSASAKRDNYSKPINTSSRGIDLPKNYASYLASLYLNDLEELCDMYGGWPCEWYEQALNQR